MNPKTILSSIGKVLSLVLGWMLFSPLFFYLSKRWWPGRKVFRWVFLILSPVSFLTILFLSIIGYYGYYEYDRAFFYDQKTLAKITDAPMPAFRVISRTKGGSSFFGDYRDHKSIRFKKDPTPEFYHHLDSLCNLDQKYWHVKKEKNDTIYSFNRIWGNRMPLPAGIADFDGFLNFQIKKGDNEVSLEYGSW